MVGEERHVTLRAFWRLLLQYPELLAWQTLWTDSQHQLYRDIYADESVAGRLYFDGRR